MNMRKTFYLLCFIFYTTGAFEDSIASLFETKIDVEGAIERFLNAVDEYFEVIILLICFSSNTRRLRKISISKKGNNYPNGHLF